jgi:hypothetical protein
MAVTVNPADLSGVTPCILVCGRLQDWATTLTIVTVCSSETSVTLYNITQRRILEATVFIRKTFFLYFRSQRLFLLLRETYENFVQNMLIHFL